MRALPLVVLLAVSSFAHGQRIPTQVYHSGQDQIGKQYVYQVREAIRGSQGLALENQATTTHVALRIVTLDPNSNTEGQNINTVISVSVTVDGADIALNGYYVTAMVQTCGTQRVRECALDTMASVDEALQFIERRSPAIYRRLASARQQSEQPRPARGQNY